MRTKVNYRKIYVENFGEIPKDENGKSFHIHHIDGNDKNNNPSNLIALSEIEHYNIHLKQSDWVSCTRLAKLIGITKEQHSELLKMANASGQCGFGLGHASIAGKIGGAKSKLNAEKQNKSMFVMTKEQELIRKLNSQTSKAIQAGKASVYPRKIEKNYKFKNLKTNQLETADLLTFCYEKSLSIYKMKMMLSGKLVHYKYWTLSDRNKVKSTREKNKGKKHPAYDAKIYTFIHDTGIIEKCTQYELRIKYGLTQSNLSKVISGKRKNHKGWSLSID